MSRITPQVHINTREGTEFKHYKTYHKDLKPDLVNLFKEYDVSELFVVRSRRGQWGEWCEIWGLDYERKPTIIKEGWS